MHIFFFFLAKQKRLQKGLRIVSSHNCFISASYWNVTDDSKCNAFFLEVKLGYFRNLDLINERSIISKKGLQVLQLAINTAKVAKKWTN